MTEDIKSKIREYGESRAFAWQAELQGGYRDNWDNKSKKLLTEIHKEFDELLDIKKSYVLLDKMEDQLIEERDGAYELLDEFVETIQEKFKQDFGEHSNLNDPWRNALEFLENNIDELLEHKRKYEELNNQITLNISAHKHYSGSKVLPACDLGSEKFDITD